MAGHAGRRQASRPRGLVRIVALGVAACLAGASARAQGDQAFHCELAAAHGLPPSDAATAARILCDELKRVSGGRGAFGVTLATLGKLVVLSASMEGTAAPVTVQVDAIEDLPMAAPRIARALVLGEPFAATQRVDNLLSAEVRPSLTKKGSVKFSVGVADVESPGFGARAAGVSFGLIYATPRFALPAEMRFGFDDSNFGDPGLSTFSIGMGGRYYLTNRNVSPFVGGGMSALKVHAHERGELFEPRGFDDDFDAERFGVAPYLEAGVEVLRLHRGCVALQVRADFPTGALNSEDFRPYRYDGSGRLLDPPSRARSRYVAPISIGLTVAF